jgi:phosphopantothenoylcysteine decarboxylase/phosphopantothenate--cysteine ligase
MYTHPATRANVARLRDDFGYRIVEPEVGALASGQVGIGRLAALPTIVDAVAQAVAGRLVRAPSPAARPPMVARVREADLAGRHIVVTAGGTVEAIDPVRFIGNRSTGRMGVAIARAALDRGALVTLIAGQMSVEAPVAAKVIPVESTEAMRSAVLDALIAPGGRAGIDALVMAAAVADFRPVGIAAAKLSRGESLTLHLEPTPDIVAEVGRIVRGVAGAREMEGTLPLEPRPVLVGFAAETGSLDRVAQKLNAKGVDLLVANDVAEAGSGFGTDTNRVTIYAPGTDPEPWPLLSKREVADRLLDRVAAALDERDSGVQTGRVSQEIAR